MRLLLANQIYIPIEMSDLGTQYKRAKVQKWYVLVIRKAQFFS